MSIRTALAGAVALATSSVAVDAATIATRTITNATHYGYNAFASTSQFNTKTTVGPYTGIARRIFVNGTITKAHKDAWLSSFRVQPSGGGLAQYQPWFQFSDVLDFEGTVNVSATIYAPAGGINLASGAMTWEMFSIDDEEFVPGVDGTSTLTYMFDDSYAPGTAQYNGTLTNRGDPTFNRPMQFSGSIGFEPVLFPPEPTNRFPHYDVQAFHVDTAGKYDLVSANEFESALVLYKGSFNPATPLVNCIRADEQGPNVLRNNSFNALPVNDDAVGGSFIQANLEPGVTYYLVMTAMNAPGAEPDGGPFVGRYNNLISGPGTVTLGAIVPEPTMLAAIALLPLVRRRR